MHKTLLTTLLLSSLAACGKSPAEPLRVGAAGDAVFSKATDDALYGSIVVSTATDIAFAFLAVMEVEVSTFEGCANVTKIDDGIRYEGTGDPACGFEGTITVQGAEDGLLFWEGPGTLALSFDDVTVQTPGEGGQIMSHTLNGTVIDERNEAGEPARLEANLEQNLDDIFVLHSQLRMLPDSAGVMTHAEGSQAHVAGIGTFTISGSIQTVEDSEGAFTTEGSVVMIGAETMAFEFQRDSDDCLPFTINGERDRICGY